ncbi:MAG: hypothetical protein N2315_01810 [Thermanaerothrix sp.]|nr:hypothetical protein [Thermanaerothrix sp.]
MVGEMGYICLEVKVAREMGAQVLRVTIDSLDYPVGLSDCEAVSRRINELLDSHEDGGIKDRYYLEVSSPGPQRPLLCLDDFRRFMGRKIKISMGKGKKRTFFIDQVMPDGRVRLIQEGEEMICPWDELRNPRLCD